MLHYPDVPMPESAIKRDELIEMIMEYDNADEERAKKRAKASSIEAVVAVESAILNLVLNFGASSRLHAAKRGRDVHNRG